MKTDFELIIQVELEFKIIPYVSGDEITPECPESVELIAVRTKKGVDIIDALTDQEINEITEYLIDNFL